IIQQIFDVPTIPGNVTSVLTVIFLLFSILHATYVLGFRNMLYFFIIAAVVSWAFEQIGVESGLIYGDYYYTDVLGLKLGHVPMLVIFAWFMMIYPSYIITNIIVSGRSTCKPKNPHSLIGLSLLSATVMTAWDVVLDPWMSGPIRQVWIWENGGEYFGVPNLNFFGWMLTTFFVFLIYRFLETKIKTKPMGPVDRKIAVLPLIAYGFMMSRYVLNPYMPEVVIIGLFVMGTPLIIAFMRLFYTEDDNYE
ncbi:MAG: carotenoid biosynthesis protein, partial [Candidatus Micrarchaeota archaeon]